MKTSLRLYFYDSGRPKGAQEMKDHPANGMPFGGACGYARDARGEYIKGTQVAVYGRSPRCRAAGVGVDGGPALLGATIVSRADFPDAVGAVRVKFWSPDAEYIEWWTLRDDDPAAPSRPEDAGQPGRVQP